MINGWVTCLLAMIVAYHDNYERYWALYLTLKKDSKTLASRTWPRHLSDRSSRSKHPPENATSHLYIGSQKMLGSLRDLQAITGAGILIAGLGQLPSLSYYHESLTICIWNLTLNSLWAAHVNPRNGVIVESDIHDTARGVIIIISVLLSIVFQSSSNIRQWRNWNTEVSGLCYRYKYVDSTEWLAWFWVAGLVIFAIHESVNLSSWARRKLAKVLGAIDKITGKIDSNYTKSSRYFTDLLHDISRYDSTLNWLQAVSKLISILATILRRLVQFISFLLGNLVAVWATGHGSHGIQMIFYFGLTLWNTLDIIDLKISNKKLLEHSTDGSDNETTWKFGQILSLALMGMSVLSAIDAFGPEKTTRSRSQPPCHGDGNGDGNE